jgi:hypothetical protein
MKPITPSEVETVRLLLAKAHVYRRVLCDLAADIARLTGADRDRIFAAIAAGDPEAESLLASLGVKIQNG